MRWLVTTLGLLAASAALVVGVYVRDMDTSWRPPERATADFDARWLLTYMAGPTCGQRCEYKVLSHPRDNHWLVWLDDRSRTQCVDIDVGTFDITDSHGVSGITRLNCNTYANGFGD